MKTSDSNLVQRADRITVFIEGIGTGLLLAYIISAFSHPLPDAVLYSAFGVMLIAAWIPVLARRRRVQEESR
jgi:hypothetical protein